MAGVPTEAEIDAMIDAMSDDEVAAYVASGSESALPGEIRGQGRGEGTGRVPAGQDAAPDPAGWLSRSGAPRSYAWLLIACSLLGLFASWNLMDAYLSHLRDPGATLTCDVSPLVSCSSSLDTWQGSLLGLPNAFVGAMAFAALLTLGVLLAAGLRPPRWIWWALSLGCAGGTAFVAWFVSISVGAFGSLCPYCMVIWAVTIPVAVNTWAWAAAGGHLGLGDAAALRVLHARWWVVAGLYLLVALVLLVGLKDQLAFLLT